MFNQQPQLTFQLSELATTLSNLKKKLTTADWLCIAGSSLGVVCVIGGSILLVTAGQPLAVSEVQASEEQNIQKLVVSISGAVAHPGVFSVEIGTRVADVLAMAGGLLPEADQEKIAKNINLAEQVEDSQQIHLPFLEESSQIGDLKEDKSVDQVSDKISINSALVAELTSLSGIGEKRAADIVAGRPYKEIHELVERQIVSENLFNQIRELISK